MSTRYQFPDEKVSFNKRDLILYALGIGCTDLKFIYELDKDFQAFPTYGLVLPLKGNSQDINSYADRTRQGFLSAPTIPKIDLRKLVHGEQTYQLLAPIPIGGDFIQKSTLLGVYDLGKSMLIENETILEHNGKPIIRQVSSAFVIGAGGFGGSKPPPKKIYKKPNSPLDFKVVDQIPTSQAMLYRLSGDYNPLHADPSIGKRLGMKGAILHGLCTFGYAANAVLKTVLKGDAKKFKEISGRFASPVYPGDELTTIIHKTDYGCFFECFVGDVKVLSNGYVLFGEVGKL